MIKTFRSSIASLALVLTVGFSPIASADMGIHFLEEEGGNCYYAWERLSGEIRSFNTGSCKYVGAYHKFRTATGAINGVHVRGSITVVAKVPSGMTPVQSGRYSEGTRLGSIWRKNAL